MTNQEVKNIKVKDLVLWTENPRDPIDETATDQDIVNIALTTRSSKWELSKLAKQMGAYFDLSEIPTVVFHGDKPVVYDGNRRVILAKIKLSLAELPENFKIVLPDFPEEIPCNVCAKDVAINNIWRKHENNGSWQQLERDIFANKYMGEHKSSFLILEEQTGLISANSHLNQGFVKKEIFNDGNLKKLGFDIIDGHLNSKYNNDEASVILSDISNQVKSKKITTRENRGKVVEVLEPSSQALIDQNKTNALRPLDTSVESKFARNDTKKPRETRRVKSKGHEFFGGTLYLNSGDVSNLYKDISDLYVYYTKNKDNLSQSFVRLIRMSLRLLCELAAKDKQHTKIDSYIEKYFAAAKNNLSQDATTTLSTQSVNDTSIVQLMHIGAHNYQASSNLDQTLAMSIILGAMLSLSHGQDSNK